MKINNVWTPQFQSEMVAAVVRDPALISQYREILDPDVFDDERHTKILESTLEYYDRYRKLPAKNVLIDLVASDLPKENRKEYVKLIKKLYATEDTDSQYVIEKAVESSKGLALKRALLRSANHLKNGEYDAIQEEIATALRVGDGVNDPGISIKEDGLKILKNRENAKTTTINFGFKELEKAMGGLERGEIATIMSPPNSGKSLTLHNIGHGAWLRGHNVVDYSLELGQKKLMLRTLASVAKINYKDLYTRVADVEESLKFVSKISGADLRIKFFPQKSIGVRGLRSHILYLRANGFDPDLVAVDYADLVKPAVYRKERREELSEIYSDLRGLAGELDIAIVTATQSRRDSLYKRSLDLNDVAEDWGKVQIADVVLAICQTKEEFQRQIFRIFVAKTRGEARGKQAYFKVDYPKLWMKEISRKKYMRMIPAHLREEYGFEEFDDSKEDDGVEGRHEEVI